MSHRAMLFVALAAASLGSGCLDPIVGSECASRGLADCDGVCVNPDDATPECTLPDPPDTPLCPDDDCIEPPTPFGHVVLIGHDYASERESDDIDDILGNAVFIARDATVNVAVYTGTASVSARNHADAAIDQMAGRLGRTWTRQALSETWTAADLSGAHVLLIHSQPGMDDDSLQRLGGTWSARLDAFLSAGGVVVVLDGPSAHSGTVQIASAAGLVAQDSCSKAAAQRLRVVDATDAISLGLPATYRSTTAVRFNGASDGAVVTDGVGPVVVHVAR